MLQLRGSVPCAVLGEHHCLFPVSSTGSGILQWAQQGEGPEQACGALLAVLVLEESMWRTQRKKGACAME